MIVVVVVAVIQCEEKGCRVVYNIWCTTYITLQTKKRAEVQNFY